MNIEYELLKLQNANGIKMLFAVESGSRAWGFASTDSDYDVRFVYARPLSWYLSIIDRRDVLEPKFNDPLLDMSGWDIRKALYQIYKGNPAFIEWLNSPIKYIDMCFIDSIRKLAVEYFNPRTAIYHYLHMAQGNYREYLRGETVRTKKYMYVIKPILSCMWIEQHHEMPPVHIDSLMLAPGTDTPNDEIFSILDKKRNGLELDSGPRIDVLNEWIDKKITHFSEKARLVQKVEKIPDDLNEFFMRTILQ